MNLQPVEKGNQALDLRTGEVTVGKMFTADEQSAIGTGNGDGLVRLMDCQCIESLEEKFVAALNLWIGTRVQSHCPEGCVQSDCKIKEQVGSLCGCGCRRGHDGRISTCRQSRGTASYLREQRRLGQLSTTERLSF